jgi:aspartyl-tRNA(Asn)/glutamyl-tRNA(Gln) amidotransferase subunit A
MGSSNENSAYGPVRNPWDTNAVPGGSSGGSAAAVAAGLAPAATGTDTGGSIRQPASFVGVSGLRPTYGRVSRYGMVAFASSLDQGGALARTAEDLAMVLDVMAVFDPRDSTCVDRPKDDYVGGLGRGVKGLRIGMPRQYFTSDLARDVAEPILAAIDECKRLGATVVDVDLPNQALAVPVYYVLAPAEASSNLSRYDGVRYGHRPAQYKDLRDMYRKARAEGFGREVKRRILIGTYVLSHGYYDAYYLKAQQIRRLIARDFTDAFAKCDVIMGPASPCVAYELGAKASDPVQMYLDDIYTVPINLAGLPGMSIPCGFGEKGRPVGLQLVGSYFDEARMLAVAHAFQQATDWHARTPPAFS